MSKSIYNGGFELGILQIVGEENLSESDKKRKAFLEGLPKNQWTHFDSNGNIVSKEEQIKEKLKPYGKGGRVDGSI